MHMQYLNYKRIIGNEGFSKLKSQQSSNEQRVYHALKSVRIKTQ